MRVIKEGRSRDIYGAQGWGETRSNFLISIIGPILALPLGCLQLFQTPDRMGPTDEVQMIRVLLVDDQAVVRRALRVRLHLEPDLEVVGEASSGSEALALAQTLTPDVVLMDIEMPGMDGIEATIAIRRVVQQSAVVILSISDDTQTRARAQAAGAVAFVEKRGATDALLAAIRLAAAQAGKSSA